MALNHDLSSLFERMAQLMEIKGVSVFKSLAYHKVARILKDMTLDVRKAVEEGTLHEIEGVGESSRKVIEQYVREGRSTDYEELANSVPAGLVPMLEIPSLGPKTISLFWKERGVTSVAELKRALEEGKLDGLKGIGQKKLDSIKQGIELRAKSAGRVGIGEALPVARSLVGQLLKVPGVKQAEYAGSLRRRRETVGDVDLICAVSDEADGEAIAQAFVAFPEVVRVLGQGSTKASILTASGLQVDLRIIPQAHFGAALMYFTGSKEHNVKLRGRALDMGLTLNEWGLYKITIEKPERDKVKSGGRVEKETAHAPKGRPVAAETEIKVYEALGMAYVPPELREDRGEVEKAAERKLPKLIEVADIRGDLHMHTTASDGQNSIEEMALAAKARGYAYVAITDHSKSQAIANGLTAERLLQHVEAIRKADAKVKGIRILAGCEVDILADGSMDFDESVLKELDVVIGSPHVALKQDERKATDRIVRAIETRYVNVIGHPTGRLIGGREGLPLDFARVFEAAAKAGVALEINAGYPRLDLNDDNARRAIAAGCRLAIDTDAHAVPELDEIEWGIGVARRAGVEARHVINCGTLEELQAFIGRKR
jgi:DNA polymerase (family 10)